MTSIENDLCNYYMKDPSWGVLHVVFSDENWDVIIDYSWFRDPPLTEKEKSLIAFVNSLSPEQKEALCERVESRCHGA